FTPFSNGSTKAARSSSSPRERGAGNRLTSGTIRCGRRWRPAARMRSRSSNHSRCRQRPGGGGNEEIAVDLSERRRFYAEEIQAIANIRNTRVVDALAAVPREQFLGPGPWTIIGEGDFQRPPRQTADDDPRHVYHNLAVAIDPGRRLFNGAPGVVAMAIDSLALNAGDRVLHLGCRPRYYTALIASRLP